MKEKAVQLLWGGWVRYAETCPYFLGDDEYHWLMFGFYTGARHVLRTIYSQHRDDGGPTDVTGLLEQMRQELRPFCEKVRATGQAVGFEPVVIED